MTTGLVSRRDVPKLPYRRLDSEERMGFVDYLRDKGVRYVADDEFWRQTEDSARKIVRQIKDGGFVVGGELSLGQGPESYGVKSHVYPKDYTGKHIERTMNRERVIGCVHFWESGGLSWNPVQIWYENPEVLNDSLELRNYLITSGISFADSIDLDRLRKDISSDKKRVDGREMVLRRLEDITLRTD